MRQPKHHNWHYLSERLKRRQAPTNPPWTEKSHLLSILPFASDHEANKGTTSADLSWYNWWVCQQVTQAGAALLKPLSGCGPDENSQWQPQFTRLWEETAKYMKNVQKPCIDALVAQLADDGILEVESKDFFAARQLVFAVIGWQTMLYKPEIRVCPPGQLALVDEMDGYKGQGEVQRRQDHSLCKRQMSQFLMGFGVLLPSSNFTNCESPEEKKSLEILKTIVPSSTNAFLLSSVGKLHFQWIDCLAHHLELDQAGGVLYLYRFPSFCLANIPHPVEVGEDLASVIHACACSDMESTIWATRTEVTSLLQETMMTYRLLFGQSKAARQIFRKLRPFDGLPAEGCDHLLGELCGRKRCDLTSDEERDSYDLARDFPMYRNRIAAIHRFLSQAKPRTWKELWQDKRDSAQWFTFWVILIFGGLGLLLAFIQVLLQVVQLAIQEK